MTAPRPRCATIPKGLRKSSASPKPTHAEILVARARIQPCSQEQAGLLSPRGPLHNPECHPGRARSARAGSISSRECWEEWIPALAALGRDDIERIVPGLLPGEGAQWAMPNVLIASH